MPEFFTPELMFAFENELEKRAFLGPAISRLGASALGRYAANKGTQAAASQAGQAISGVGRHLATHAGGIGAGAGLGAAGGGAVGAGAGALHGYQEAKEKGESGFAGALTGAGGGAYRGALIGGAGGAALGATGGRASRALAGVAEGASGGLSPAAIARFGQRQLHSVTGLTPGGAPRLLPSGAVNPEYAQAISKMRIPGTGADASGRVEGAATTLRHALERQEAGQVGGLAKLLPKGMQKARLERQASRARKGLERAQSAEDVATEAVEKGMTNLPGIVRHAVTQPGGAKDLWRLGIQPQWKNQGGVGKALVALPAIGAAQEAATAGEDEKGRGRGERMGDALGMGLGYASTPFMPLAGSEVIGRGAGAVAGGVGKGIDKLVGAVRKSKKRDLGNNPGAPAVEEGARQGNVEREVSDRSLGKSPDIGIGGL